MTLPTTSGSRSVLEPGVQRGSADLCDGGDMSLRDAGRYALAGEFTDGDRLSLGTFGMGLPVGGMEGELLADAVGVHAPSVKHLTLGVDKRKVVYMANDYTEDQFYGHIVATLDQGADPGRPLLEDTPLMNFVASQLEWKRAKAALLRWIAEKDDEYDELAIEMEHEDPDD